MNIAMLSAMSLVCADISGAAPIAAAAIEVAAIAQLEAAEGGMAEPLPTEVAPAETLPLAENNVSDEEEYAGPLAFEGESDDAVAERFAQYLEETKTLSGDFTQMAPSGAISTGRFYLRRPGFLRFEYDPPTPMLIVANGGMVYVRDEALETTDSYPVGKTPLKFLLGKRVDLEDAKLRAVDRGIDNVALTFGSDDDETEGELTVIAKAPEMTLIRWIVRDTQNGVTVVNLDNVKSGQKLANRLFQVPEAGGDFLKN